MSIIGEFGFVKKSSFDLLLNNIKNNMDEIANCIDVIIEELEESDDLTVEEECPGEVYTAMFEYFEQTKGIDVRGQSNYSEIWREMTEDFDVIIMTVELKKQLNIEPADYSAFGDFLNDFYQMDFGDIAEIALRSFENNLEKLSNESVLVFRLY